MDDRTHLAAIFASPNLAIRLGEGDWSKDDCNHQDQSPSSTKRAQALIPPFLSNDDVFEWAVRQADALLTRLTVRAEGEPDPEQEVNRGWMAAATSVLNEYPQDRVLYRSAALDAICQALSSLKRSGVPNPGVWLRGQTNSFCKATADAPFRTFIPQPENWFDKKGYDSSWIAWMTVGRDPHDKEQKHLDASAKHHDAKAKDQQESTARITQEKSSAVSGAERAESMERLRAAIRKADADDVTEKGVPIGDDGKDQS